jgi:hypothetical protein
MPPVREARVRRVYDGPERAQALLHLRELAASGTVTLLTATRDLEHSQAADLAARLRRFRAAADACHYALPPHSRPVKAGATRPP